MAIGPGLTEGVSCGTAKGLQLLVEIELWHCLLIVIISPKDDGLFVIPQQIHVLNGIAICHDTEYMYTLTTKQKRTIVY